MSFRRFEVCMMFSWILLPDKSKRDDTRDNGIITGSSDYAADGLCVLTNLNRNTLTQKSDQVITTGLGGVFPADVLVGVVREVVPEVSGKSSIAVIEPGADPRTVRHAFIITNF